MEPLSITWWKAIGVLGTGRYLGTLAISDNHDIKKSRHLLPTEFDVPVPA